MYDLEKHKMQLNIPKKQLCRAGHAAATVTHIFKQRQKFNKEKVNPIYVNKKSQLLVAKLLPAVGTDIFRVFTKKEKACGIKEKAPVV